MWFRILGFWTRIFAIFPKMGVVSGVIVPFGKLEQIHECGGRGFAGDGRRRSPCQMSERGDCGAIARSSEVDTEGATRTLRNLRDDPSRVRRRGPLVSLKAAHVFSRTILSAR
jgi:hypothetical protein